MLTPVAAVASLRLFRMIPVVEVIPETQLALILQTKIITSAAGEIILKTLQPARYGTTQLLVAEALVLLLIIAAEVQIALPGLTIAAMEVLRVAQADSPVATAVEAEAVAHHLVVEVLHQEAQEVAIKRGRGSLNTKNSGYENNGQSARWHCYAFTGAGYGTKFYRNCAYV